jgi:tetratricopeptide (TPR) repeat protein
MTDFTSVSIPPPKDWQAFERHSRVLFEYSLADPQTQNNGRPGQRQHGVDIYGRRGGNGVLVGVQCKGKDNDYGGTVSDAELLREVKNTEQFVPPLDEFILITTAPDDASIQEAARLLEQEVQRAGRQLKIAVWGWGRVHQEITRFPEVIKEFHPDASPFHDLVLSDTRQIKELVQEKDASTREQLQRIEAIVSTLAQTQIAGTDAAPAADSLDKHIHDEINTYRDMIDAGKPRTAISLLTALQSRLPATASNRIRFRIIANIGTSHHRLGEFDLAARFFLEAWPLNPDDPPSIANKIAALIIQGKNDEAHALAVDAITRFPQNLDIALQRLQALGPSETTESVWSTLPPILTENERLVAFRVVARRAQQDPEWRALVKAAAAAFPNNRQLKATLAEAVLGGVLEADRAALGAPVEESASQRELIDAAETFASAWATSLDRETPPDWSAAHNGALAYVMVSDVKAATTLLDTALSRGLPHDESKRLRISLFVRANQVPEAIALADSLSDSVRNRIYRADVRVSTDPPGARALLADQTDYTDPLDRIGSAQVTVDSYLTESNFAAAAAEGERLQSMLPDDPYPYLLLYRVHAAQGDTNAASFLEDAVKHFKETTDFATRFMVAVSLARAGRFEAATDLLLGHVTTNRDSPALRELVGAAVSADRRAAVKQLLDGLPRNVLDHPFYRKARAALALRSGNPAQAEHELRGYLALQPRSLDMQLHLLRVLARQERTAELKKEVARRAAEFDGTPEDLVSLAQFKEAFGSWQEAYDLAYRTWLSNQNNAAVNIRYVGVFLRRGHSRELEVSPAAVGENMAVTLRTEDGARETFIIEPDPDLRPTPYHLPPGHATADLLMHKHVGAEIQFADSSKATIDSIKPKQLHALHIILEGYQKLFPGNGGLERVPVKQGQPGAFQPIFDRVRERHDAIQSVFDAYAAGGIPIAVAASSLGGGDSVAALLSLIESNRPVLVCEGTAEERQAALDAINANARRGCVLDALTLHIVHAVHLEGAVRAVCGPIGIVERTDGRIQERIEELEAHLDEPDNSLIWRDGQIYRVEVSPQEKKDALEVLLQHKQWIATETELIPAQATQDPSADVRALIQEFGSGFVDDMLAAQGAGRLLVSEDKIIRGLAGEQFGLGTSWLQPILMKAADGGHLSRDDYNSAILTLIKSGFDFVSVDPTLLVWALHGTSELQLTDDFLRVAARLGGPKAELDSHVGVALNAIRIIWADRRYAATLRLACVGTLLYNLSRQRPVEHFIIILRAFVRFGAQVLTDPEFADYLRAWVRGHFIVLPPGLF